MKAYKKIITIMTLVSITLYAENNESISKIDEIKALKKSEKQAKKINSLLHYDAIVGEILIEQNIHDVEIYRIDTLDKLGENKECHIIAERIKQYEKRIKEYQKYTQSDISKYEIMKAKKNIRLVKKSCPNYKDFKGDN